MNKNIHAQTAQNLASMGRYGDSMLVHMTPGEVAGLQSLAQANGTSLTINPKTGLPEAFILAPLVGLGLKAAGMSALGAGITTGLLGWAITGDLGQGLMSGLGGFGGANLGGALGKFGAAQSATPTVTNVATTGAANVTDDLAASVLGDTGKAVFTRGVMGTGGPSGMPQGYAGIGNSVMGGAPAASTVPALADLGGKTTAFGASSGPFGDMVTGAGAALKNPKAFYDAFPDEALTGLGMAASPLIASALAPPTYRPYSPTQQTSNYEGPYFPTERQASFPTAQEREQLGTKEFQYFNPVHPYPGYTTKPYEEGGIVTEVPDPGSDPVEGAQETYRFGIGGITKLAAGGTAEKDYGLASPTGPYTDSYSIPSAAFQAQLDAREKQIQELMNQNKSQQNQMLNYGIFSNAFNKTNPGLTRAQAEARLGPAPQWTPPQQTAMPATGPTSAYQGTGITTLPQVQQPQLDPALVQYMEAANRVTNMPRMAKGGFLNGPGDGMSDSIPATIEGNQPARLADGEFVIPADVVSHLGNGSTKAGAQRLYAMMDKVRQARTGTKKQGKEINPNKFLPA